MQEAPRRRHLDGRLAGPAHHLNLRTDPFEQATVTSNTYWDWCIDHAWVLYPLSDVVGEFLATFKDYPPRMKAGSFTIGDVLKKLEPSAQ